jgi:hypothetical protein
MAFDLPSLNGQPAKACPKPERTPRKTPKRLQGKTPKSPEERERIALVRQYVFARERNRCRICRCRPASEMHELRPRSLRGRVSRTNSIAVDATCHRLIQGHAISYTQEPVRGAEASLYFMPMTGEARTWMKLGDKHGIESPPSREMEAD